MAEPNLEKQENREESDFSATLYNQPSQEKLRKLPTCESPPSEAVIKESTIMEEFPTPFKKTLYWPSTSTTSSNPQRKKNKEKVPAVATSMEWQQYFSKKEQEKEDKIRKIEEKKRKREETANKKKGRK